MQTEEISQAGSDTPANESEVNVATPAVEENSVESKIARVLGSQNVLPAEGEESEEGSEDQKETSEKKDKDVVPATPPKEESKVQQPEPVAQPTSVSRIDKRIATKYIENLLLKGDEADVPSVEDVIASLSGYTLKEKEQALHNLLRNNRILRNPQGGNEGSVALSEEDQDALAEAKAEERFAEMQSEIRERARGDDLVKTLESHPELDSRRPEFDPKIEAAVDRLYEGGMLASEAYELVMSSISSVRQEAEKKEERQKQSSLSGALSGTSRPAKSGHTAEEIDKIQRENPSRFMEMLKNGEIELNEN